MDDDKLLGSLKLLVIFALVALLSTHCFTTLRYLIQSSSDRRYKGNEPPTLPYKLPGIGSALDLVRNPHGFFDSVAERNKHGEPLRLRLGNIHAYLIRGGKNIQHIFRSPRDLTFEDFALRVAHKVKRLPSVDTALIAKDVSGSTRVPLVPTRDEDRIWRKFHDIHDANLTGAKAVSFLTDIFIDNLMVELSHVSRTEWTQFGVDEFVKAKVFRASTTALVGSSVFEIDPDFAQSLWDYDAAFMSLLYGIPKFLCRKGWDARDKCLKTIQTHLERAWQKTDWPALEEEDPIWEPNFGSKVARERVLATEKYGLSLQGQASFHLGLIWSINANAIPITSWIIIEILRRPDLYPRIEAEVSTVVKKDCLSKDGHQKKPTAGLHAAVDIPALKKLPLLNSIYLECLRLRSSVFVVRKLRNDMEVDGYQLKAGNLVLAPSYLAQKDAAVWSTPEHPAEEFWPERFAHASSGAAHDATTKEAMDGHSASNTPNAGNFFPYGGGSSICPGRNYAKQEVLASVALFFACFDIEVLHFVDRDGKYSDRGPALGNEARGVAKIDKDLLVRLRRRV